MLRHRLIFGPLMIAVLIGVIYGDSRLDPATWYAPGTVMLGATLVIVFLCSGELYAIFRAKGIRIDRWLVVLGAVCGCILTARPNASYLQQELAPASLLTALLLIALVSYSWRYGVQGAAAAGGAVLLATIYIGMLPGFLIAIRHDYSAPLVAAIIIVVKACDIGAYFTGRAIGRHKLIAWLSPGKTWEGLAGGVASSALLGWGLALWSNRSGFALVQDPEHDLLPLKIAAWFALLCGAVLGLVGQFGDLVASLLKRDAGIKDSASTLPGFGGILDVADSVIIAAPAAYWLLRISTIVG